MLQRILRKQKWNYYQEQCIKFKSNTNMVNYITKCHSDKSTVIDSIKINNIEKTSAQSITNGLGDYFSIIGAKYAEKIGKSN